MRLFKFISLSYLAFQLLHVQAATLRNETSLDQYFEKHGLTGTFVLLDPVSDTLHVYNQERAKKRYQPASTFKIANALIGLDLGVVTNVDEIIPYGGTKELIKDWEKDMSLRNAMKISNVAVFHQLAKRIGIKRMSDRIHSLHYGNENVGSNIETRFWLQGPLEISAIEQVDFLFKLTSGKLQFSEKAIKSVKEIIKFEESRAFTIYAKTGWVGPEDPQIGWWVGWVQRGQTTIPFALNIDIKKDSDAKLRIPIARECLKHLGKI